MQVSTPTPAPIAAPRKKRHVFLWIFLTVQAVFILWLITGGATADHSVTHCTGIDCKGAAEAGSAIGIVSYGVYRLATRR